MQAVLPLPAIDTLRDLSRHPALRVGVVAFSVAAAVWSVVGARVFAEAPAIIPLYPAAQSRVEIIDVRNYSVAEVVEHLTIINRFEMMLYNGGALQELRGEGPYTVFAPADNYFDYVPKSTFLGLTRTERTELARAHIVPRRAIPLSEEGTGTYLTLGGTPLAFGFRVSDGSASVQNGFVIKAYEAKNGMIYVVNRVLVPETLSNTL